MFGDGGFFFKQKTAYEMRISDWSSDVCSSDLDVAAASAETSPATQIVFVTAYDQYAIDAFERGAIDYLLKPIAVDLDRKSVVSGKSVSVRVALGCRRLI